jgi:hypothetical protein
MEKQILSARNQVVCPGENSQNRRAAIAVASGIKIESMDK